MRFLATNYVPICTTGEIKIKFIKHKFKDSEIVLEPNIPLDLQWLRTIHEKIPQDVINNLQNFK
jgi:hypothetical protein